MMIFKEHGQIFFGEVFDKRVRMLFAARRYEDGNVHRRERVSKTVTKNMWEGFLKKQGIKERPKNAPAVSAYRLKRGTNRTAGTAEMSFCWLILAGMFTRCTRLTMKSMFQIFQMMKISGFQPDDLKNRFFRLQYQTESLKEKSH
jgi:hypothetical protein